MTENLSTKGSADRPKLVVLVQDSSDYGGSSEFWIKWRGDAENAEAALREAFAGDGWKPRHGNRRTIDAVVVGPEVGWAEYEVRILYPDSEIESIKPTKLWIRRFDDDDDEEDDD